MDFQTCSKKTLSRKRPAVHADGDPTLLQQFGEGFAGELAALIGVEYPRFFIPGKGFFHCLDAEENVHGDRHVQSQHTAAG